MRAAGEKLPFNRPGTDPASGAFRHGNPMSTLIFSFLQILPIFFLIGLGTLLRWRHVVNDAFLKDLSGLVFYVLIPPLLFLSIGETDLKTSFDPRMIFPSLAGVLIFSVLI